jgi:phosphomannomutase
MTLIKSTSGIRGTIGGRPGLGLTPFDIVKYAAAFGQWTISKTGISRIVLGKDARASGEIVRSLVTGTLQSLGIEVIDLGLSATPTVAIAISAEKAGGGIVLSASHYPKDWNAVKLLNQRGEVIDGVDGAEVGALAGNGAVSFSEAGGLGKIVPKEDYLSRHIDAILELPLIDKAAIEAANFHIAVDGINSVGGIAVPRLLRALGVQTIYPLFCEPDGEFGHDPELLQCNLWTLSSLVMQKKADMGVAVDPDVNRLFFICEDGLPFRDEYLPVAIADHVLHYTPGNIITSIAASHALIELTANRGYVCINASAGEAHVVEEMKTCMAVLGADGNGGVIYPGLHYTRDALAAIALFLSHAARTKVSLSQIKADCSRYYLAKNSILLEDMTGIEKLFATMREKYGSGRPVESNGLKIETEDGWVYLRRQDIGSQVLIYAEARNRKEAEALALRFRNEVSGALGLGRARFKTDYQ